MDKMLLPELMANISRIFVGLNMIREAKNDIIRNCPDEFLDDALFETLGRISDGEFENEADAVAYMRELGFPITDEKSTDSAIELPSMSPRGYHPQMIEPPSWQTTAFQLTVCRPNLVQCPGQSNVLI